MLRTFTCRIESWPLNAPFRIARGVRTSTDVIVVSLNQGGVTAHGEGTPTARYGETTASALAALETARDAVSAGADRTALRGILPPGAARNALDCALWDLEARLAGLRAAPFMHSVVSARTISIDTPEAMGTAARAIADARLIKVKLSADDPAARLRAVRANAPAATIVVDANEGWTLDILAAMQPVLAEAGVAMLEQPLPAAEDGALQGFARQVPICADESCHVAADVARLRDRYDLVNIKLDKAGGLTEALDLYREARAASMGVMVGCMLGTSLAMAPALRVAAHADFVDLDGPWWLREDRAGGMAFAADGSVSAPAPSLWTCDEAAADARRDLPPPA